MVLSSNIVVMVANISANVCQYIACNPERLSSDEMLNLLFCLPLQHIGRLSVYIWTFLCYNPDPANLSAFDFHPHPDDHDDSHSD
ncbi:hypothetical protein M5689_024360 [Euphorbia peplus]|nr:hypothetical protein M5689_024360 [Euphorbia peplus]